MPHSPNYPRCNRCCVKSCNKNKGLCERCNGFSSTLHQPFTPPHQHASILHTRLKNLLWRVEKRSIHTPIYTYFFARKSIHTFTKRLFLADFHLFQVWRVGSSSLHTALVDEPAVNGWKSKYSHFQCMKIRRKEPFGEGVNAFLGEWNTYI